MPLLCDRVISVLLCCDHCVIIFVIIVLLVRDDCVRIMLLLC